MFRNIILMSNAEKTVSLFQKLREHLPLNKKKSHRPMIWNPIIGQKLYHISVLFFTAHIVLSERDNSSCYRLQETSQGKYITVLDKIAYVNDNETYFNACLCVVFTLNPPQPSHFFIKKFENKFSSSAR